MPKRPFKHPKPPKPPKHGKRSVPPKNQKTADKCEEPNNCTSFLDQEICVEAKVTVNPSVSIGKAKIECVDSSIESCSKLNHSSEECTVYVNQLIRVKIPIRFSAKAEAEKNGVSCKPVHSDESSSSSTESTSSSTGSLSTNSSTLSSSSSDNTTTNSSVSTSSSLEDSSNNLC